MKLFISTKEMTFNEEDNLIKHEIILCVRDMEFYGYDKLIELPDDDKFIKDTLKIKYKKDKDDKDTEEIDYKQFIIREDKTWWSFPEYEIIDGNIIPFKWGDYSYFVDTDRRMALASKINELYNQPSEFKILRKTIKTILDHLGIIDESFEKYNTKVEDTIEKNPK